MKIITLISITIALLQGISVASTTETYKDKYKKVREYFTNSYKQDFIEIGPNKKIFYISRKGQFNKKKVIFIVPGWAEPVIRYEELLFDLKDTNVSIIGYDHPSQGYSYRGLKDHFKTHVESFDEYTNAMDIVYKTLLKDYEKVFVISHSMGANIVAQYADLNSKAFDKVVMYTPLFRVNTRFLSQTISTKVANYMASTSFKTSYTVPKFILDTIRYNFFLNGATRSKERFEARFYLMDKMPEMMTSGPTWQWAKLAFNSNNKLIKRLPSLNFTPEVLVFQGEDDNVVSNEEQDLFCKYAKKCTMRKFKEARHWIHQEIDEVRDQVINETKIFLEI